MPCTRQSFEIGISPFSALCRMATIAVPDL